MNPIRSRHVITTLSLCLAAAFPLLVPAAPPAANTPPPPAPTPVDDEEEGEMITLSPFEVSCGYGATPGGAQDINFFRSGAGRGEVPHPNTITAEGLFSEHDLPLQVREAGDALLCVQTAAAAVHLDVLPEARWLAQLGFSSGLRPDSWKRAPLNLVAVVDKSGSMDGPPLALVRASLLSALDHLRDGDQLSIVLYGDTTEVFLETTCVDASTRSRIAGRIAGIQSSGSTFMEAGLRLGYEIARAAARDFQGTTRVMLFTDERPNVGNTDAASFMGMAQSASRDGIGLTTIGVGVQFGAELATKISSVRGGNLFFFPDGAEMQRTFAEDFDTMVTELAHDFTVRIAPAAGLRVAGVFGVPGELLRWDGDALVLDVATLFLSKRNGAIYFALAPAVTPAAVPANPAPHETVARVTLSYLESGASERTSSEELCRLLPAGELQSGLRRGSSLVDEYLCLKKAATLHLVHNDQENAFRLVQGLTERLAAAGDPDLDGELKLATSMRDTLAVLSGHAGALRSAVGTPMKSPLVGVWRQRGRGWFTPKDRYVIVWPNGVVELITVDRRARAARGAESLTVSGDLPEASNGALELTAADQDRFGSIEYACDGDALRVRIETLDGKPAVWSLRRCAYSDLPLSSPDTVAELDEPEFLVTCDFEAPGLPERGGDGIRDRETAVAAH